MISIYRSIPLVVLSLAFGAAGATAQVNNPGNTGGAAGSKIATPTYPPGEGNPALTTGKATTGGPASADPHVPGATGSTVVPGNSSSISADRRGTTEQRTGELSTGGSN